MWSLKATQLQVSASAVAFSEAAKASTPVEIKSPFQNEAKQTAGEWLQRLKEARKSVSGSQPTKYFFLGNPGTGMNTLLNGLIGKEVFESGLSGEQGLTFQLDEHAQDGDAVMNMPGLSGVETRKQAAEAITSAFREGGNFKIVFVITLEAGCPRPADKSTMQLVLDSAPIENYGVVINQVSKKLCDKVTLNPDNEDPTPFQTLLAQLFAGVRPTEHVFANLSDSEPELGDADYVLAPVTPGLCDFLDALPPTRIEMADVKDVRDIQADHFEEHEQMFEEKLSLLAKQKEAMKEELARSGDAIIRLQAKLEEDRRGLLEQLGKSQAEKGRLRTMSGGCALL